MGNFAYVNGALIPSAQATVSVFDPGFMFGDGLFETFRVYEGRPLLLDRHLERLSQGLAALNISNAHDNKDLTKAIMSTIEANGSGDFVVRLTITRGNSMPTTVITTRSIPYSAKQYETGVACVVVPETRGALATVKSLNYLPNRLAKLAAAKAGALEAIWQTNTGALTEGTMSNVFVYTDGILRTPDLSLDILDGITRQVVLKLAKESGLNITEGEVEYKGLSRAGEVFITNSVAEIMPVVEVDGMIIGGGKPGPVTKCLRASYKALT
jgi:branched-chain amino acid aminotransferase